MRSNNIHIRELRRFESIYILQEITGHTSCTASGMLHAATFHEEDTKPWTKITNTRVRTPMKDPSSGLISTQVSGYDPATYIHVEWGTTWFKYLGQPSYRAYWFHMSAYDQFVNAWSRLNIP